MPRPARPSGARRARVEGCATLLAILIALTAGCTRHDSAPRVAPQALRVVREGALAGFANADGGWCWLGIPYAAPPLGDLRWRAPRPALAWRGVRPALSPGAPCVQYGWPLGGVGATGTRQGQEDCLTLNVYAPPGARPGTTRLPVMVWVHGGSNTVGQAANYDGGLLARSGNVLVVMPNYRLGPFGWFVMPRGGETGSEAQDPLDASGNFGLLDLVASLRWVHDNARAFGGDPDNVTLFGESAGASNVLALLVSPLSEGLLHRAILQSLAFRFAPMARVAHARDEPQPGDDYASGEILLRLLVDQRRAADRASAKALVASLRTVDIAAFLRGLDPWTVYRAYHPSGIETDRFPTLFQDGTVLPEGAVEDLLADPARHRAVPTMLGTNRDEATLFMAFDRRLVRTMFGIPVAIRDRDAYRREDGYRSVLWQANGVDRLAQALVAGGAPVYAYRFGWRDEGSALGLLDASTLIGATHGLELPFLFGHWDVGPYTPLVFHRGNLAGREALGAAMRAYWSAFARDGRPGRGDGDLPSWPPWAGDAASPRTLLLDASGAGGVREASVPASREEVVRRIELGETDPAAACTMFRATFRNRHDDWADDAWRRLRGGACAAGPAGGPRYPPP